MKKVLSLVAVAGVIAAGTAAFGGTIVNSKHDLSNGSTGTAFGGTSTQICVYCHAPHAAIKSLPLWNRINPEGSLFTLYSGVNMQSVSFKTGFTADSTSLFCMSCHDGVTGMGAVHNAGVIEGGAGSVVGNYHTAAATVFGAADATAAIANTVGGNVAGNLTRNLSTTHPINFPVVTANNSQNDLNVGTGAHMGPGVAPNMPIAWTATRTYPLFKSTADNADGRRTTADRSLECGSCHAVHDTQYSPFLRDTMTKSQLCLGCHNK